MGRDIIEFTVKGYKTPFTVYAQPSVKDTMQMEKIAAELHGGMVNYKRDQVELEILGEEFKLEDPTKATRQDMVRLSVLAKAQQTQNFVSYYSALKVLKVSYPDGFNVDELGKEEFSKVSSAYEVALKEYFRHERKNTAA